MTRSHFHAGQVFVALQIARTNPRGVTRTPGCAVAMYRNRHQSPCISDSFAFQDQHITKSTEMVFAPNPTAASTDSKKKSVVFYSCGRTSPSDLDGILLGSPTPRCEG